MVRREAQKIFSRWRKPEESAEVADQRFFI
jgi:hypothetical protein